MAARSQLPPDPADVLLADVASLVRAATGLDGAVSLALDEPLATLGLDSLALVNAVAAVETAFGRELPDSLWEDRRVSRSRASRRPSPDRREARRSPRPRLSCRPPPASTRASRAASAAACSSSSTALPVARRRTCSTVRPSVRTGHAPRGRASCSSASSAAFSPRSHCRRVSPWPATTASPTQRSPACGPQRKPGACTRTCGATSRTACTAWRRGSTGASWLRPDRAHGSRGCRDAPRNLLWSRPLRAPGLAWPRHRPGAARGSLRSARELGFVRQARVVRERNRPMIAAATQMLGFAVAGRAERRRAARPRDLDVAEARVRCAGARLYV